MAKLKVLPAGEASYIRKDKQNYYVENCLLNWAYSLNPKTIGITRVEGTDVYALVIDGYVIRPTEHPMFYEVLEEKCDDAIIIEQNKENEPVKINSKILLRSEGIPEVNVVKHINTMFVTVDYGKKEDTILVPITTKRIVLGAASIRGVYYYYEIKDDIISTKIIPASADLNLEDIKLLLEEKGNL